MTARSVTLVTGASSGIGRELARVFAAHGHDLALTARDGDTLARLAAELGGAGRPLPLVIAADLSAEDGVARIVAALAAADATVDILVNNAGYGVAGDAASLEMASQIGVVDLNVRALLALTLAVLPQLRAARGRILNVASVAAFFPGPGMAVYYASKAFVLSLSRALWQEERAHGVGVTALCPGFTPTGFQVRAGLPAGGSGGVGGPDARAVANRGYAAMMARRRVVVPGLFNKFATFVLPLLPDALVLPLIARIQKRRR